MLKTVKQLADEIGAKYIGQDTPFKGFSIDTRTLKPGEIFVAVKGERVDGHKLVDQAIKKQVSACMTEYEVDYDIPQIIVKDTRIGLGLMAKAWRNQFDIPFISITGSCGKTTVKEMLGSILNQADKTLVTEGNLNSDFGVPLMLGRLDLSYHYAVLEAGSSHLGEIEYLAKMIQPDIAAITNVDAAHLDGFGSLDGVMKEKGALLDSLTNGGIAIINLDDQRISHYSKKLTCSKVYVSQFLDHADVYLLSKPEFKGQYLCFDINLKGQRVPIELALWGKYQIHNALMSIAMASSMNIPLKHIINGLKTLKKVKGRFMPIKLSETVQLIDDTYNASVPSVKAAIDTLGEFDGKRVFVMGHMGELGVESHNYHYQVGQWLKEKAIDEVYLYGDYMLLENTIKALPSARYYKDKVALISDLKSMINLSEKTWIVVKGSRATEMEAVINDLVIV